MKAYTLLMISMLTLELSSCGKSEPTKTTSLKSYENSKDIADASSDMLQRQQFPLAFHQPATRQKYGDVIDHPWIRQQPGLVALTDSMVSDIRSLKEGHELLNQRRKEAGLPETSFEQETSTIVTTIEEIQNSLAPLHLAFPTGLYSILNIPLTSASPYNTPLPFDIYKRVELGQTSLGVPYYLDVRAFDLTKLDSQAAKEAAVQAIINWHQRLLKPGAPAFTALQGKDTLVLLGHGERDRDHFDGSHGFATNDRGVFLAFFNDGRHLYVLHADAPWQNLQDKKDLFLKVVNRPLKPLNVPVSSYKLTALSDESPVAK